MLHAILRRGMSKEISSETCYLSGRQRGHFYTSEILCSSSLTRNRGRYPSDNTRKSSEGNSFVDTPTLRNGQRVLGSNMKTGCMYKEYGVVSVTGRRRDAVSLAPVLMGIAAFDAMTTQLSPSIQ